MRVVAYVYSDPLIEASPTVDGWGQPVDRVYQDQALPATPEHRPQLEQLLQDSQAHPPDTVLVRSLAELGPSLEAVSDCLQTFAARGITLIAVEQGFTSQASLDGPTALLPQQQWTRRLIELGGEIQAQQRRRRLRHGHAQNRIKALPPPGKAPYGYRRGVERYTLDRSAAPVVKAFFDQFLLYGSLRQAVRYLETRYGKRISVSTGQRWLTSPVYRGDLVYQDGQRMRDTHVPILSREEAAQIDRLLRRNSRLPPRTASAPRSLAGIVTCQTCQSPMKVSQVTAPRREKVYLYLRPTACPRSPKCRALSYDAVLEATIETICRDLPTAVAALNLDRPGGSAPGDAIAHTLQQKNDVLTQLPALVESGILDQDTADLRAYTLRSEIAQLQQRLAQLPPVNLPELARSVAIPQFWLDLSEPERRFFFREFIQAIQIEREGAQWRVVLKFIF